ncbi:tetr bacterial regulatory protein hth signature [Lucifera butyrica]|uniref:Tetr bacterial regulatory protein hth signature n=1 Tax=Lucifera butyrica TaxID=1351585 RepID=A0A498R7S5_9FIRM|nr:TetR/AcrR family transcriptional regulator [Lucifera butyrica]VBB07441.1 tetr bacterial regulatory protein hth signature [Lucifera butyrica]
MLVSQPGDSGESKKRILDAAKAEFSHKGFEGARVDKIADKAGVNKALIYYYFKSKDRLLQEIISEFFDELLQQMSYLPVNDCCSEEYRQQAFERLYLFMNQRKAVIRIILAEMAKGAAMADRIITESEAVLALFAKKLEEKGILLDNRSIHFKLRNIFFGITPMLMFTILKEPMARHVHASQETVVREFKNIGEQINQGWLEQLIDTTGQDSASHS